MGSRYLRQIHFMQKKDSSTVKYVRVVFVNLPDFDPTDFAPTILSKEITDYIDNMISKVAIHAKLNVKAIIGYDFNNMDKSQRRIEALKNKIPILPNITLAP